MTEIITYEGQTLLDIALQHTGDASKALDIALANGISLSDNLEPGATLTLPDTQGNKAMTQYYTVNNIMPATSLETEIGGINYMGIEIDFIVS